MTEQNVVIRVYVRVMPQYMGIDQREWERNCDCGGRLDWVYSNSIESSGSATKRVVFRPVCVSNCRAYARGGETGHTAKHVTLSADWQPLDGGAF